MLPAVSMSVHMLHKYMVSPSAASSHGPEDLFVADLASPQLPISHDAVDLPTYPQLPLSHDPAHLPVCPQHVLSHGPANLHVADLASPQHVLSRGPANLPAA